MHRSQVLYREAAETDCPQLIRVHYAAVQALASSHYPAEVLAAWSPPPDEARRIWLAGVLAQEGVLCTVDAAPDGELVGFCIAAPEQSLLRAIYVHPACAGRGIGRGLLQRAEAQCRQRGVAALWLNASYNAQAFYVSCGYEAVGPVTYPLSAEASMGAIRMVKHVGSAA
jgi:GNAT superfamily N-acetyltransferase